MYLNTFAPQMQHEHHTHNFNMMNTRSLVLPNPSDTKVATLILSLYNDTFLHYFQDNVSVYSPAYLGTILVEHAVQKLKDTTTCVSPSAGINGMLH